MTAADPEVSPATRKLIANHAKLDERIDDLVIDSAALALQTAELCAHTGWASVHHGKKTEADTLQVQARLYQSLQSVSTIVEMATRVRAEVERAIVQVERDG